MVTLLGLGSALVYGTADFLGGAASRRATALSVLLISAPVGLLTLIVLAVLGGGAPTLTALAWGFGSGLAGGAGLITFYRALAKGPMSVVAPVSALAAAVIPVAVGTMRGERLAPSVLVGVLLCLGAIVLVSMDNNNPTERVPGSAFRRMVGGGPVMAGLSGAGFGLFFVVIHEAGDGSGYWPLVASRGAGALVILAVILVLRFRGRRSHNPTADGAKTPISGTADLVLVAAGPPSAGAGGREREPLGGAKVVGATLALAIVSGLLDGFANLLYFLASEAGMLSLAAVLTSLYPAVTVLLARIVYSERLRVIQRLGLAVAVAGVALVTIN